MQTLKINNVDALKLNLSHGLRNVQMLNRSFFSEENLNIESLSNFYTEIYNNEKHKGIYDILGEDTVITDIGCGLSLSTLLLNNLLTLKTVYLLDLWDSWDSYGVDLRSTVNEVIALNDYSNVKLVDSLHQAESVDVIISRVSLGWDLGDDVFNATLPDYLASILHTLKPNGHLIFDSNNDSYKLLDEHFTFKDISPLLYLGDVIGYTVIAQRKSG